MKITKYKHACLVATKENESVVIDPGIFSDDFIVPSNVAAIIITHEHGDHLDPAHIASILDKNPSAQIFGHKDSLARLQDFKTTHVSPNETISVGSFKLTFVGGEHARIHSSIPAIANLGVLIDDTFYYPGDSFFVPNSEVSTLALPISAPWLKMSEVIDFLTTVHPRLAFPTHDELLSDHGKQICDRILSGSADANHITYRRLIEPLTVDA